MTRMSLPTITPLPILILSSDNAPRHGAGVVFTKRGTEFSGLHVVGKKEALLGRNLSTKQQKEVNDLIGFRRALENNFWMDLEEPIRSLGHYIPHIAHNYLDVLLQSKSWPRVQVAYAGLISNLIQSVTVVMWCANKEARLRPGLFCPDLRTAAFTHVAMGHLRTCLKPGCGERFIQCKETHVYCCGACQNSHHQAMWKADNPEKAKEYARRAREKARRTRSAKKP